MLIFQHRQGNPQLHRLAGLALHNPARMRLEQREQLLLVRDRLPLQHATADLILQTHRAGVKPVPSRQLRRRHRALRQSCQGLQRDAQSPRQIAAQGQPRPATAFGR